MPRWQGAFIRETRGLKPGRVCIPLGSYGVRMSRRGKEALPRGRVERGELKAATNEYDFRFEWYNKGPRARGHYLLNNITGPGRATWPT